MIDNITPKISIVIPTYNAEQLVCETINSVLEQIYDNWEIIIVDDCSTDGTVDLITRKYINDSRIIVAKLTKNHGGPAGPRNHGVNIAKGDYIAFLDSDDIWHPMKLEMQVDLLNETEALFVCSSMIDFKNSKDITFKDNLSIEYIKINETDLMKRDAIPTSSVLIARKVLLANRFNESFSFKAVEDYHCWMRSIKDTKHCFKLKAPLMYYRRSDSQISSSKVYMTRKVYMIHRNLGRSVIKSFFCTFTHVFGGVIRYLKKGM